MARRRASAVSDDQVGFAFDVEPEAVAAPAKVRAPRPGKKAVAKTPGKPIALAARTTAQSGPSPEMFPEPPAKTPKPQAHAPRPPEPELPPVNVHAQSASKDERGVVLLHVHLLGGSAHGQMVKLAPPCPPDIVAEGATYSLGYDRSIERHVARHTP